MKKLSSLLLCIAIILCIFSSCINVNVVNAQVLGTLYASQDVQSGTSWAFGAGVTYKFLGNAFVASASYDPVRFSFRWWSSNVAAITGAKLYIYETDGANTLTSLLLVQNISVTGLGSSSSWANSNWFNVSITGGVTFEQGKKYAVFATCDTGVISLYRSGLPAGWQGVQGATMPPSIGGDIMAMQVYGLPAGSTIPGNLSYTFVNSGTDNSNVDGNSIMLSMTAVNGRVTTSTIPVGQSITVNFAPLVAISWNYSDALSLHRTIEFMGNDGVVGVGQSTWYLRTANTTTYVNNVYVFNVVDYTGSAQFVEVTLGGDLVGRKSIAMSGVADFALVQGLYYTVSVVGSLGSFSQGFVAGATLTSNIIVLAGSFGEADWQNGLSDMFFTNRTSDNLGVNVFFNSVKSGSFNLNISKLVGAGAYVVDSIRVDSAFFPLNYVYGNAEANVVYRVHGVLYDVDGGVVRSWVVDVVPSSGRGNVWAGLLAPFMRAVETVPGSAVLPEGFDIAQWPAALIVLGVLAIFSWKNHGVGSMLAWVVAAILFGLGWWTLNLPAFGFALFVAILILIYEGKRTEREV